MMVSPHFFLLRLRNASLFELIWRLQQRFTRAYLNFINIIGRKMPDVPATDSVSELGIPDLYRGNTPSVADYDIGMELVALATANWNNKRKENPVSATQDIRLDWEPARLQLSVALMVYAHHCSDIACWENAKWAAKKMILTWLNANPFARGIHYCSAMECALRIPVFFMALKWIDNLTLDESDKVLSAIYRHGWLISKQLSLYSSLGNHTVAEAVGLIFAGAVYRSNLRGKAWLETGISLLSDELSHQILDDGGPAEQSLGYHRFVLDLYWLVVDFIQKNKLGAVHHWKKRLLAGEFFLSTFQDEHGFFPSIGDTDNGYAIAPDVYPARVKSCAPKESLNTFEHSGYSVIRNGNLVFTLDHGPLGMAPFYNHGHADALSITLSKNGHPLLVDPGTYRYNGVPEWRRYFKGTRAHNTVIIDDQDQANQATSFIWSKPYNSRLTTCHKENGNFFFNAAHDGYTRLKNPVQHQRSVVFFDQENFLIKDRFFGTGVHCFQLNFHLHPNAVAAKEGRWWIVDNGAEHAFIRLFEGDFQIVRGQTNPMIGWFSGRYGIKEPSSTLTFTRTGNSNAVVFTTMICTQSPFDLIRAEQNPSGAKSGLGGK